MSQRAARRACARMAGQYRGNDREGGGTNQSCLARLLGLDMPTKVAVTDPDGGIPLETIRRVMERVDRQTADITPEPAPPLLDHKETMRNGSLLARCRRAGRRRL